MISELKPGERLDDLERNGLMLIQHPGRFCYGVDAVLLSWFAKASEGERVLDFLYGDRCGSYFNDGKDSGIAFYWSRDPRGSCKNGISKCGVKSSRG